MFDGETVTKQYTAPTVEEYGAVETITLANEKCNPGTDEFEDTTSLSGSIQECEPA